MRPLMYRRTIALAATLLAALVVTARATQPQSPGDEAAAIRDFQERVEAYAALHRRLEGPLLPDTPSAHPQAFLLHRARLAAAIKQTRPGARQGDIFTPAVASVLRYRIAKALAGRDTDALVRDLYEEHGFVPGFQPRVYDRYPEWGTHEMPLILLQHLPHLPEDVEYRLLFYDLVLWDIHADLIVDVLPRAIPRSTS